VKLCNAALLAVRILALSDPALGKRLAAFHEEQAEAAMTAELK